MLAQSMQQGVWILSMVLQIGQHDVIIKPIEPIQEFHSYQLCILSIPELEEQLKVPITCENVYLNEV